MMPSSVGFDPHRPTKYVLSVMVLTMRLIAQMSK